MTDRNFLLAIVFVLTLVVATNAQDDGNSPAICKGYGKSIWGESPDDTAVNVTDLKLQRSTGNFELYESETGPAMQTTYQYYNKRLYYIIAKYKLPEAPEKGVDEAGVAILKDMVKKKYHDDPDNAKALQKAMIVLHVVPGQNGKVNVIYDNRSVREEAEKALEEGRRKRVEKARKASSQRFKAIEDSGISEQL
ncbi:MAG TPA: hypothetical protein DIT01_03310 [Lentisphaeria bacterium]|nr:hypothetical protein [Lentisphaeria bacterium]|tara:strand:+ start:346 stop:927 length:582 start_codon:yes stop_codon:yes gene_type:complete